MSKRNRCANYTADEKLFILTCVESYLHIIECKKTDATTNKNKKEAWEAITDHFNSQATSGIRTPEQIKHYYENTKSKERKNVVSKHNENYIHTLTDEEVSPKEVTNLKTIKSEIRKSGGQFKPISSTNLKNKYFLKKIHLVNLQRHLLLKEDRRKEEEHKIKLQILHAELIKLKN